MVFACSTGMGTRTCPRRTCRSGVARQSAARRRERVARVPGAATALRPAYGAAGHPAARRFAMEPVSRHELHAAHVHAQLCPAWHTRCDGRAAYGPRPVDVAGRPRTRRAGGRAAARRHDRRRRARTVVDRARGPATPHRRGGRARGGVHDCRRTVAAVQPPLHRQGRRVPHHDLHGCAVRQGEERLRLWRQPGHGVGARSQSGPWSRGRRDQRHAEHYRDTGRGLRLERRLAAVAVPSPVLFQADAVGPPDARSSRNRLHRVLLQLLRRRTRLRRALLVPHDRSNRSVDRARSNCGGIDGGR